MVIQTENSDNLSSLVDLLRTIMSFEIPPRAEVYNTIDKLVPKLIQILRSGITGVASDVVAVMVILSSGPRLVTCRLT
jgi:hypothetical protein